MKGWNTGLETAVKVEPGSNHMSVGWVQNLQAVGGWVGHGFLFW